jgi:uncharacterized protein with GYD domain
LKKDEEDGFDSEEAPGDVPAFLGLWSPRQERQQDNGIGDGDRPLQPRRPIFNLCHAAPIITANALDSALPGCMIRATPQVEEGNMPNYLHQVAYTTESWQALISQPQDRLEAVRSAIEKLGGKLLHGWFAFGDYDIVAITEMPDNVSAAALAIAFAGGGACKSVHTTPLLNQQEAMSAMKKAGESGYRPIKATARAA